MIRIYKALVIWGVVNIPFTFLFAKYSASFLGSMEFFAGFFIILIIGLIKAHEIDTDKYLKG